ncbi:MAG: pyridoxamine 5'-phosphate oxidase family protein [Gammaproteobacteria bacterium]|nr:pyridoxamine 5'-phosphate oxidase family protein [Gammaproteobacteria bacterium]
MTSTIDDVDGLRGLYGAPSDRAIKKELTALDVHCEHFIRRSPFLIVASVGQNGNLDCSPRGDAPGFVQVLDSKTVLIPDRRGNNRVDTLSNVVEHPKVGLLFMIPGVNETLRLNGRATIETNPDLLEASAVNGKVPRTGLRIEVEEVFLQCAKALVRSKLWAEESKIERKSFPSLGEILSDQIAGSEQPEVIDSALEKNTREALY